MKKIDTEDFIKLLKSNTSKEVKKTISNIVSVKQNDINNLQVDIEGVEYENKTINEIKKNIFYKEMPGVLDFLLKEYYVDINFIEKYIAFINFNTIIENQILTEDFLMDFVDEIDWKSAIIHQDLSDDFIKKIFKKINVVRIEKKQEILTSCIGITGTSDITTYAGTNSVATSIATHTANHRSYAAPNTDYSRISDGIIVHQSLFDIDHIFDDIDINSYMDIESKFDDNIIRTIDGVGNRSHFITKENNPYNNKKKSDRR